MGAISQSWWYDEILVAPKTDEEDKMTKPRVEITKEEVVTGVTVQLTLQEANVVYTLLTRLNGRGVGRHMELREAFERGLGNHLRPLEVTMLPDAGSITVSEG